MMNYVVVEGGRIEMSNVNISNAKFGRNEKEVYRVFNINKGR